MSTDIDSIVANAEERAQAAEGRAEQAAKEARAARALATRANGWRANIEARGDTAESAKAIAQIRNMAGYNSDIDTLHDVATQGWANALSKANSPADTEPEGLASFDMMAESGYFGSAEECAAFDVTEARSRPYVATIVQHFEDVAMRNGLTDRRLCKQAQVVLRKLLHDFSTSGEDEAALMPLFVGAILKAATTAQTQDLRCSQKLPRRPQLMLDASGLTERPLDIAGADAAARRHEEAGSGFAGDTERLRDILSLEAKRKAPDPIDKDSARDKRKDIVRSQRRGERP